MTFRSIVRVAVVTVVTAQMVRVGAVPSAHAASCNPVASLSGNVTPSGGFANAAQVIATFDNARNAEGCTVPLSIDPAAYDAASQQTQMLMVINAERRDRGLGTLTLDPNLLSQISLNHSREMAQYGYFNHPSPINHPGTDTNAIFGRITVNPAVNGHYTNVAENIAAGYTPAAAAVYTYMYQDSGSGWGHRHNILGWNGTTFGAYDYTGIGIANGGTYGVYYTNDFLQSSAGSPYVPPSSPDTQAPGMNPPTIAAGSPGGTVTAQVTGVSDTGSCCGEAGVTGVVFYADSITMDPYGNANTVVASQTSPGVWSAQLNLPAGSTLHAVAVDGSGNFDDCAMGASACQTSPAVLSSLAASAPATATAGSPFSITVTAKDNLGSTYTSYTGTVHFTSTDPLAGLPADYTFTAGDNGTHTFTVTLKTAGSQSVTATDTANSSVTGAANIHVNPAAAQTLIVTVPSSAAIGQPVNVSVTAKDAYGNLTTGYTGTIHFSSTDTGSGTRLPANYTFTAADAGTHVFNAVFSTVGSQTITAADTTNGSVRGTSNAITITATPQTVPLTVYDGWNLIGGDPVIVYPGVTAAYSWDATTGQWTSLSPGPQTQLPVGQGAWEQASATTAQQVEVLGCTGPVYVSAYPHRWNLVANPCNVPVNLPAGSRGLSYLPAQQQYQGTTQIPAGAAAWVMPPSNALALSP